MNHKEFETWLLNKGFKKLNDEFDEKPDFIKHQDVDNMNMSISYLIGNIDVDDMCTLSVYLVNPSNSELLFTQEIYIGDVISMLKNFTKIKEIGENARHN